MTTCEIQKRILYLEGQIKVIQKNNGIIKKNIADLEESGTEASTLASKWEKTLSDCFDAVKNRLANVDKRSGFKSYYLESINSVFSCKEASEISECFGAVKLDTKRKIDELKSEMNTNDTKLRRYQIEIEELRAIQVNGSE